MACSGLFVFVNDGWRKRNFGGYRVCVMFALKDLSEMVSGLGLICFLLVKIMLT